MPATPNRRCRAEVLETLEAGAAVASNLCGIDRPVRFQAGLDLAAARAAARLLFVNAAIAPTDSFIDVMVADALSPGRIVEALASLVTPAEIIGGFPCSQGGVCLNTAGRSRPFLR